MFARPDGSPVHPDLISQTFQRFMDQSELPRIRLHDLRHTHASLGLQAGVPVKVISERLGHADVAFTMNTYAHIMPGMQAQAAADIAALVDHNNTPSSTNQPNLQTINPISKQSTRNHHEHHPHS